MIPAGASWYYLGDFNGMSEVLSRIVRLDGETQTAIGAPEHAVMTAVAEQYALVDAPLRELRYADVFFCEGAVCRATTLDLATAIAHDTAIASIPGAPSLSVFSARPLACGGIDAIVLDYSSGSLTDPLPCWSIRLTATAP